MSVQQDLDREFGTLVSGGVVEATSATFLVERTVVNPGTPCGQHVHEEDQLAVMTAGSVEVSLQGQTWRLRGEQLVWIPVVSRTP
jgi:quercetin dioxygenase-like cupin family protein